MKVKERLRPQSVQAKRIREFNDAFRRSFQGGRVMLTASVNALEEKAKAALLEAIRTFDAFDDGNDPYREHDFVSVEIEGTTYFEALELDHVPEQLIVLGGGYVGAEFAQAFQRFGSKVTVVEFGPQLMGREDADVAEAVRTVFVKDGIEVILGAATQDVEGRSGESVRLRVKIAAGERRIVGSDLLVAAGRTPNTHGIGLDLAGVELDRRGYVKVNERLETTAPGVWAMGECAGSPQFTHVAFDDFRIVRDNLAGGERTTRERLVPYCVFIDPELTRVGLSETEANQKGLDVRVVTSPMTSILRARTLGETHGFMKALIDARNNRILGFTAMGPEATEAVAVVQTAMLAGLPYMALRDAIFTHPTMAEGLNVLFANTPAAGQRAGNSKPVKDAAVGSGELA